MRFQKAALRSRRRTLLVGIAVLCLDMAVSNQSFEIDDISQAASAWHRYAQRSHPMRACTALPQCVSPNSAIDPTIVHPVVASSAPG